MNCIKNGIWLLGLLALCACADNSEPVDSPDEPCKLEYSLSIRDRENKSELTSLTLDFKAAQTQILVIADGGWKYDSLSIPAWISVEKSAEAVATLKTKVNTFQESRSTVLSFTSAEDSTLTRQLTVTQCGSEVFGGQHPKDIAFFCFSNARSISYTRAALENYVKTDATQPDWLFDGFIFAPTGIDGKDLLTNEITSKVKTTQQDWAASLDCLFRDGSIHNLLEDAVESSRAQISGQFVRRRVIAALPFPCQRQQDWGSVDGKKLNFNYADDRIEAMKWYIDEVINRFAEKDYDCLALQGFYWTQEFDGFGIDNTNAVAEYIHSLGLEFYWIPFYDATNWKRWQEMGFDHAYLQPNYSFNLDVPDGRLEEAVTKASSAGMNLEVEMDDNFPLERNRAYWDVYEQNGILEDTDLAYYIQCAFEGFKGSPLAAPRELYERMCRDIVKRQKAYYDK